MSWPGRVGSPDALARGSPPIGVSRYRIAVASDRLEPVEGQDDEKDVERRPADEDARVAAVCRAEVVCRPLDDLEPDGDEADKQGERSLAAPCRPPCRALIGEAEPDQRSARDAGCHHERAEGHGRGDVLRVPEPGVVQRPEVEVREDEREEEERSRAGHQVPGGGEVPAEQLGRLRLDDVVSVPARAPRHRSRGAPGRRRRPERRRVAPVVIRIDVDHGHPVEVVHRNG